MLVYMYAAALYCEECGEAIRADLKGSAPEDMDDDASYDSDDFPKGPMEEGETDSPSHCEGCGLFLESELTEEGYKYMTDIVKASYEKHARAGAVASEWKDYYGVDVYPENQYD